MMFCSDVFFNESSVQKNRGGIAGCKGAFSKNTKGISIVYIGNTDTGITVVNGGLGFRDPVFGKRSFIDRVSTTDTARLLIVIQKKVFGCVTT